MRLAGAQGECAQGSKEASGKSWSWPLLADPLPLSVHIQGFLNPWVGPGLSSKPYVQVLSPFGFLDLASFHYRHGNPARSHSALYGMQGGVQRAEWQAQSMEE